MTRRQINHIPSALWRKVSKYRRLRTAAAKADFFIASYPKSGRTWLRYIVSNYLNIIHDVVPEIDLHTTFHVTPNFDLDQHRGIPAFEKAVGGSKIPLVLVTHLRNNPVLFRDRPIIFLVRDPKDVLVSSYFHAVHHKKRFSGDMTAYLEDPSQGVSQLVRYQNSWASSLSARPHKVISYEDLSHNAAETVKSIFDFVGWNTDKDALQKAVRASTFDTMRKVEKETGIPGHEYDLENDQSGRMRRGVVGGFDDDLTPQQISYIDRRLSDELSQAANAMYKNSNAQNQK